MNSDKARTKRNENTSMKREGSGGRLNDQELNTTEADVGQ